MESLHPVQPPLDRQRLVRHAADAIESELAGTFSSATVQRFVEEPVVSLGQVVA